MEHFLQFLKRPTANNDRKKIEWLHFFALLFSFYLVMLPIGFFIKSMNSVFCISQKNLSLEILPKILIAVAIAPIVEELFFRLLLIVNKRNLLLFSLMSLLLSIYSLFKVHYYQSIVLFILSTFAVILSAKDAGFKKMATRYYPIYFYAIAIIFGLGHFTNYNGITGFLYLWIPLLVLPQIIMGLYLGYIRVNYGIIYSILFHMIINLIAVGSI